MTTKTPEETKTAAIAEMAMTSAMRVITIKDSQCQLKETLLDHQWKDQMRWDNHDRHTNWVNFFDTWPFIEPAPHNKPYRIKLEGLALSRPYTAKESHSIDKYAYKVTRREPNSEDVADTRNPPQIIVGP